MLLLVTFLTPLVEFFDRWDPPGPGNDTEFAVFSFILALVFVLLVSKLTASLASLSGFTLISQRFQERGSPPREFGACCGVVIPDISPPLRI